MTINYQNIHATKRAFKDLAIGDTFDFVNMSQPMLNSFYRRCAKISTRKYQAIDEPKDVYTVGSISAKVYHVHGANDHLTLEQILDRDVPAIVTYSKNWARQGVCGPLEVFYQHEVICVSHTAIVHDPTDEGWKPAGFSIPCNVPYEAYWRFLYARLGNVPLYAKEDAQ